MKKYLLGIIAIVMAVGFSSFSTSEPKKEKSFASYTWYAVDYSVPGGIIPANAQVVMSNRTIAEATALDGCSDTPNLHCLRGFSGTPPTFPTASYDASTPKP
jgi:hypothetical protein